VQDNPLQIKTAPSLLQGKRQKKETCFTAGTRLIGAKRITMASCSSRGPKTQEKKDAGGSSRQKSLAPSFPEGGKKSVCHSEETLQAWRAWKGSFPREKRGREEKINI